MGHVNFFPSSDRILRTYPYFISTNRGLAPSGHRNLLMVATDPKVRWAQGARKKLWVLKQPCLRELIFYHQPFLRISAIDLLEPSIHRPAVRWVNDKIVLIGVEARGLHDMRVTPLGERTGLDIHATALSNWLQRRWVLLSSFSWRVVFSWIIWRAAGFLLGISPRRKPWFWGCYLQDMVPLAGLAFHLVPFRLPFTGPLLAFGAAAMCRLAETVRRERTLRKHLEELQRMKEMLAIMLVHDHSNSPLNSMRMLIGSILPEQGVGSKIHRRLENALC